ncbi:MAG TPA: hypothetical protein VJU86_01875 [Pyrinomonadaceae bacterium]|nr:hypothetical protein [Pyrinomonadaceae bacterium]
MPSREHTSDDGKVRVKVSTISTNFGAFIEWGAEAWRERRYKIESVWWQPWTWGRYEWRRRGSPPNLQVDLFRANDTVIEYPNPSLTIADETGYRKKSLIYYFIGVNVSGSREASPNLGPDGSSTGSDARSVTKVVVTYTWDGAAKTLTAL